MKEGFIKMDDIVGTFDSNDVVENVKQHETFVELTQKNKQALSKYWPAFLSKGEADDLYDELYNLAQDQTLFNQDVYKIMGKNVLAPRITAAFGSNDIVYNYSGMKRNSVSKWPPQLLKCMHMVEEHVGCVLNYAFVNIYKVIDDNGDAVEHYIGWHCDKEKEIVCDSTGGTTICSISVGDPRKFQLRQIYSRAKGEKPSTIYSKVLEHGSLLTMEKHTQQLCKHRVPKKRKATTPRINITFRNMKQPKKQKSSQISKGLPSPDASF